MDDEERNQQEFDFNSSMTDLMTSLMVIFVLLLVILFNNIGEKGQKIRDKSKGALTSVFSDAAAPFIIIPPAGFLV